MNLLRAAEFKVGLLVLSVASLVGYMSMQVTDDPSLFARSNEAWFLIKDAAGLVKNSSIKTAGIPVGIIKEIRLQDGQARVELQLRPDIKVYVSAEVEIKSQGILGDKYIEIFPGSVSDPLLPKKGQIIIVRDKGSLDNVIKSVADIADNLKEVAKNLKEATSGQGTRDHVLGRIVQNIEKLTGDLASMTSENKDKIGQIVDQVSSISNTLDELINDESDDGFRSVWKKSMARIDSTLKNVDEISQKINKGEGTIGRLINDEDTVEQLNTALDGVNGFLDTAGKTSASLDFNAYYLGSVGATKTNVGVKLQPGLDRYYYLGIVDDPAGVVETTETKTTQSGSTSEISETKTYKSKVKFNVQFAKNFYDFTVRGGLIESAGGVGFDYMLLHDKLKLSLEAFEFSKMNLRTQIQYSFYKGVYVVGGVEDMLDKSSKRSSYLGAGLLLTNDDLKLLMGSGSLPLK
jgi:phospholipid/cholesterol/gamma-HCH transport system substrate-binding protein